MASSTTDGGADDPDQEIRLVDSGEYWVATDVDSGVASQGKTRLDALANLDEALSLHDAGGEGPIDTPEEERAALRELGIDPEAVHAARADSDELPEFMQ